MHVTSQLLESETPTLEEWHRSQAPTGQGIASFLVPESLSLAIVNIENHEPIRQSGITQRVARSAPLAEENDVIGEMLLRHRKVLHQPLVQTRELTAVRHLKVGATVLYTQLAFISLGNT